MAWLITKDLSGETPEVVGVCGPGSATDEEISRLKSGEGHTFRILDGDQEMYFQGRSSECDFSPLDDYGEPSHGATTIQYLDKGVWATL